MTGSNAYVTYATLAGQSFHKGSLVLTSLLNEPATPVRLERESMNKYDRNAIKVFVEEADLAPEHVERVKANGGVFPLMAGYIEKAVARDLAYRMDAGEITEATLDTIVRYPTVRVIIRS